MFFPSIKESLKAQLQNRKAFTIFKLAFTAITFTGLVINACVNFIQTTEEFPQIKDRIFDWTVPINRYLQKNNSIRNFLMVYSSFLMDVQLIAYMLTYIYYSKSHRMTCLCVLFYGVRGILQYLCVLPFADDYIWNQDPGFPSLSITYDKTSDFFYSGHVGSSTFSFFEFRERGFKKLMYMSLVSIISQGIIAIITRSHWTIDVFAGFIVAHYVFILAKYYNPIDFENQESQKSKKKN